MRVAVITAVHQRTPRDKPKVFVGYGITAVMTAVCNNMYIGGEFDPTYIRIQKLLNGDKYGETDVDAAYRLVQERLPMWTFHIQDAEVEG